MDDMMPLMRRASERTSAVVAKVPDDRLGLPTPCAEFDVEALINHLEYVAAMFESLARGETPAEQGPYAGDFPERTERTLAAWSRPEAWEGTSPALGMPMTAVAHLYLVDMLVHGWDLARAVGVAYEPDAEAVDRGLVFTQGAAERAREFGVFGPAVPVADDAPAFERLLGITGRDPAWTAPRP